MQYHQEYTIYGTCLRLSILPKNHAKQYLHSMFCKIIALKSVSLHLAERVMQKKGWQDTKYCNLFLLSAGPIMRRRGHGVTENRKISPFLLFLPLNRGQRVKGEGGGIHIFCECWVCKTRKTLLSTRHDNTTDSISKTLTNQLKGWFLQYLK